MAAASPQVKSLSCPNCGGTVTLRGYGQALTVVCVQCLSVLDARTPGLRILQTFQSRERFQPIIPLGKRGKLLNGEFEAIGFQVRELETEDGAFRWEEYLLFNPYKGFRYLSHYQGHWNAIRTIPGLPQPATFGTRSGVRYAGENFKHFQAYNAKTIYVMGEFPWQVRVDETAECNDFIAVPRMLSSEKTEEEITWSLGDYTPGTAIWQAFQLPGQAPAPVGVFANQPSPFKGKVSGIWGSWMMLTIALIVLAILTAVASSHSTAFEQSYSFSSSTSGEHSFVTPIFELKGRPSIVEVQVSASLSNDWAYFSMALINDDTGEAYDFGREVSYYSGSDSDGSWTEGSLSSTAKIPSVPAGRYYLRVEPEMETGSSDSFSSSLHTMNYQIRVIRDSPAYVWFWFGFFVLLIPPIVRTIRATSFEKRRWDESDHPMVSSS